jgi:hypothetical protein
MPPKNNKATTRYGIGELYGHDFSRLPSDQIRKLSKAVFKSQPCPFRGGMCNKKGGVCSLRQYSKTGDVVTPLEDDSLTATCPSRFYDSGTVLRWVGKTLIDADSPVVLTELPFLMTASTDAAKSSPSAVGKIDMVLVHPDTKNLRWCALEMQAVYFSGPGMTQEFKVMKTWDKPTIPFPKSIRRPDFRSSGPKRLMPQLQIKVPTISRWGKKMAVIVDLPFWESLGNITEVENASNCDIAWFVVKYEQENGRFVLKPGTLHLTTLDRAVEGLTGGKPTSLTTFEKTLRAKLSIAENV